MTKFAWDAVRALSELVLERDGSGNLKRRYLYGRDLVQMATGGSDYTYHHDGLGTVASLTSDTGNEVARYLYEPFGSERAVVPANPSTPDNRMLFTGEYLDPAGLYHLRARQYDPALGQFLAPDPAPRPMNDSGVSTFLYADGRPTVLLDPSGMRGEDPDDMSMWEDLWSNPVDAWLAGKDDALALAGDVLDGIVKYGRNCLVIGQGGAIAASPGLFWQGFVAGCVVGIIEQATLEESVS